MPFHNLPPLLLSDNQENLLLKDFFNQRFNWKPFYFEALPQIEIFRFSSQPLGISLIAVVSVLTCWQFRASDVPLKRQGHKYKSHCVFVRIYPRCKQAVSPPTVVFKALY
jgi:hypothetical protein